VKRLKIKKIGNFYRIIETVPSEYGMGSISKPTKTLYVSEDLALMALNRLNLKGGN
jgi:hypothetical protein